MALRRYQHKFLQPLEIDQERVSSSLNTNLTTTNLTVTNSNVTTQTVSKLSTNNFFNSATPDYTPSVETLTVFGDPNVSQGAIAHIRNNNVSVNDANVFGGLKFSSSPGADFIIGKSTQLGSGFLQVRRETGTVNLSMDGFGNVTLNTGNLVIGTSGKGIDFSVTTNSNGTMSSELFNDYEEGTWSPFDNSGAGLSFGISDARYTKIGRMVFCHASITWPTTANGNNVNVSGLPYFSNGSLAGSSYGAFVAYTTYTSGTTWLIDIASTSTRAYLLGGTNATNTTFSARQFRLVWVYEAQAI